jgi:ElaB/YqjD/DUF883 family membrane-anchored ribosome-binding protein
MATPTPKDTADVGRLEHEIAQVRGDLGRTVQEIGSRLTPAHLMEQAKRTLKEGTVETTKAVAQSATDVASDVATRTRDAALDARDQVQAHPYAVAAAGAGIGVGYWLVTSAMRRRRRLVPREWDQPFDRSSRRPASSRRGPSNRGAIWSGSPTSRLIPLGAAVAAAWLIWQTRDQH